MSRLSLPILRLLLPLIAALCGFVLDVSIAEAQSQNCSKLNATLNTLERNRDLRNLGANSDRARAAADEVQQQESQYVRGGCNAAAKAGQQLTRQCQNLARSILSGRKARDKMASSVETGTAVSQQREALLQQIARFDCRSRSNEYDQGDTIASTRRGNLFERLFGVYQDDTVPQDGQFREDEFEGYGGYHTVRTVCVRLEDGFFWPISYSTLVDYVPNDAEQCQTECPGTPVDLYYYDNPGQEAEQMINQTGELYTSLPSAFRYRTDFDRALTCKPATDYGAIHVAATGDGQSRLMLTYGGTTFPLPVRDPRAQASAVTVATAQVSNFVNVPLPRKRPAAPGETPTTVAVAQPAAQQAERIVQYGDKRVRIVGPVTPYAPAAAAGT